MNNVVKELVYLMPYSYIEKKYIVVKIMTETFAQWYIIVRGKEGKSEKKDNNGINKTKIKLEL